jgi:hypothetical protein
VASLLKEKKHKTFFCHAHKHRGEIIYYLGLERGLASLMKGCCSSCSALERRCTFLSRHLSAKSCMAAEKLRERMSEK